MNFFDYFAILIAAIGSIGLGRLVISEGVARSLLAGSFVLACIASLMAWIAPNIIAPIFRVGIGVGWMVILVHLRNSYLVSKRDSLKLYLSDIFCTVNYKLYVKALISILVIFYLFLPIHYNNYFFFPDDVVYFAPLVEIFLADYTGGIRVPTYYPALMSSHQITPTMFYSVFCSLIPDVTLVHAIEIRYILASAFLSRTFFILWKHSELSDFSFLLLIFCVIFLFRSELSYLALISTSVYVLFVIELFLLAVSGKTNTRFLFLLALGLILLRLPFFYAGAALVAYTMIISNKVRFSPVCICMVALVLFNLIALSIVPKPFNNFSELDLSFSLVNPFSGKPSADYRNILGFDRIVSYFPGLYLATTGVIIAVALGLLKYYYVAFLSVRKLSKNYIFSGEKIAIRGLELYLLVMFIGWVVVRWSQRGAYEHVVGLCVIGYIAVMALTMVASQKRHWIVRNLVVGVAVAAIGLGISFRGVSNTNVVIFGDGIKYTGSIRYEELSTIRNLKIPEEIPTNGRVDMLGVKALLLGKRLMANDIKPEQSGMQKYIQLGSIYD